MPLTSALEVVLYDGDAENVALLGKILEVVSDGDAKNVAMSGRILEVVLSDGDADTTIFSKVLVSMP